MTIPHRSQNIEMIAIADIDVLNPRLRNKRQHRLIVENIEAIGLKRPITVSRKNNGGKPRYDLICGEGRLEAFRMLGAAEIPAIVTAAPESDCLVMSLVENIARRQHRPIDIIQEITRLRQRGYSEEEIAQKIGCTAGWVKDVMMLLERGEERLVCAVETGLIPIGVAVDISRAESNDAQNILVEAYETGKIKAKRLRAIRRLLDQRLRRSKGISGSQPGGRHRSRRVTADDLMRLYQREAEKQRLLAKKADFTQAKLLFIVEALKDLLADEGFNTLLRAESLDLMPRALAARLAGEVMQ
jgi:ParB family chromosome partitioning protein